MRVNVYAEEMTDRVEIKEKVVDGVRFTGVRFYLYLPVSQPGGEVRGPFVHQVGDDDSSAVTFWGKSDFRDVLRRALVLLDGHYSLPEIARREMDREELEKMRAAIHPTDF